MPLTSDEQHKQLLMLESKIDELDSNDSNHKEKLKQKLRGIGISLYNYAESITTDSTKQLDIIHTTAQAYYPKLRSTILCFEDREAIAPDLNEWAGLPRCKVEHIRHTLLQLNVDNIQDSALIINPAFKQLFLLGEQRILLAKKCESAFGFFSTATSPYDPNKHVMKIQSGPEPQQQKQAQNKQLRSAL